MRAWMDVAVLMKAKGKGGRLVAKAAAGLPFLLEPGDEVALVPPRTDVRRTVLVRDIEFIDGTRALVQLDGVCDDASAGELAGMHCLIRRDLVDEAAFDQPSSLWEGWLVVDSALGKVGTVRGIVDNPAHPLLDVEREDGAGSVLVPVVEEIVTGIDAPGCTVAVMLPSGLLDL